MDKNLIFHMLNAFSQLLGVNKAKIIIISSKSLEIKSFESYEILVKFA